MKLDMFNNFHEELLIAPKFGLLPLILCLQDSF